MDARAFTSIVLRLSGVVVIVYAVTSTSKLIAPTFLMPSSQGIPYGDVALSSLFSLIIPVAVGLVLVWFPATVTSKVLRVEGTDISDESASLLQYVAFSAIGLWLVVFSVIDATYYLGKTRLYARYIQDNPVSVPMPPILPDDFGGLLSCGVQFVLGILLLVGGRGLARLGARLRGHAAF